VGRAVRPEHELLELITQNGLGGTFSMDGTLASKEYERESKTGLPEGACFLLSFVHYWPGCLAQRVKVWFE